MPEIVSTSIAATSENAGQATVQATVQAAAQAAVEPSAKSPARGSAGSNIVKPPKPYPTYPLFAHAKGYWCKTIAGRQKAFGRWAWPEESAYEASWKAALKAMNQHLEDRANAVKTVRRPERLTLDYVKDAYLTYQHTRHGSAEISARMFHDCREVLVHLVKAVGTEVTIGELEEDPTPFQNWRAALDGRLGWHAFNRWNAIASAMFRWAEDRRKGGPIGRPTILRGLFEKKAAIHRRRAKRLREAEHGKKIWTTEHLRLLIDRATPTVKALLLLGYYCAFGNTDCADLSISSINFSPDEKTGLPAGWATIHFPRPKTEIERASVIPPRVVQAVQAAIALGRPAAQARWQSLVFRTTSGFPFVREEVHRNVAGVISKVVPIDAVGLVFKQHRDNFGNCPVHGWQKRRWERGTTTKQLCQTEGCNEELARLPKLGFYVLRHTAITIASGVADDDVLHRWRGHALRGMSDVYVEDVEAHKLKAIADRLTEKLFGDEGLAEDAGTAEATTTAAIAATTQSESPTPAAGSAAGDAGRPSCSP